MKDLASPNPRPCEPCGQSFELEPGVFQTARGHLAESLSPPGPFPGAGVWRDHKGRTSKNLGGVGVAVFEEEAPLLLLAPKSCSVPNLLGSVGHVKGGVCQSKQGLSWLVKMLSGGGASESISRSANVLRAKRVGRRQVEYGFQHIPINNNLSVFALCSNDF